MKKHCTYLSHWLQANVINIVESKSTIICFAFLHSVWEKVRDTFTGSVKNSCVAEIPPVSMGYREKWKKIHDYNENYEDLKTVLKSKENCKEYYCKYIADISNIYNDFKHVCNGKNNERCPEYWNNFGKNYPVDSEIEKQCKEIYEKLGLYNIKFYFGEQDIEEYIEQYESEHTFSFFEKLIAPKSDDMRKMWRNVQGVTNPASLLNPMKPPGGGNKIGLLFLPK
ncbi:Plasmodium vivax Vir protein, putative [Plasmodium ovale]|uniref:Plasmodium vivax Vir protein, putative n=1 Tax=Plasmodium ovale TaxID=36330 RepID=A0A1C3KM60_PLAOA|nr:Plasmodium vivax Vir protein, putative [Plasmodium ovale]